MFAKSLTLVQWLELSLQVILVLNLILRLAANKALLLIFQLAIFRAKGVISVS
jgi:hypothetical protein